MPTSLIVVAVDAANPSNLPTPLSSPRAASGRPALAGRPSAGQPSAEPTIFSSGTARVPIMSLRSRRKREKKSYFFVTVADFPEIGDGEAGRMTQ